MPRLLTNSIEALIIFLILFTPFAFGSVETWAFSLIEIISVIMFILWALRFIIGGSRFRKIRFPIISIPVVIFIAYVGFQLFPLEKDVVKELSPNAYKIYAENINGYDTVYFLRHLDKKDPRYYHVGQKPYDKFLWKEVSTDTRPISIWPKSTLEYFFKIISCFLIFFTVINSITEKDQIKRILVVIIFTGFLLAFVGIIQKFTWNGKLLWFRIPEHGGFHFGPFVNKNHAANYLGMVIPAAIGFVITRLVIQFKSMQGDTYLVRVKNLFVGEYIYKIILQIFIISIMIAAVIMSQSLMGIIALLYGMLFFILFMFMRNKRALRIVFSALIVVVPLLVILMKGGVYIEEMVAKYMIPSLSEKARMSFYMDGMRMVNDFFWYGTGLGTFWYIYPKYQTILVDEYVRYAHNDYLQLFIETGVVAAGVLIISIVLYVLINICRVIFAGERRSVHYTIFGIGLGLISMMIHSIADFNFQIPSNTLLFVILGALLSNMLRNDKKDTENSCSKLVKKKKYASEH